MRSLLLLRASSSQLRRGALRLRPQHPPRHLPTPRALSTTPPLHHQDVFHAQSSNPSASALLASLKPPPTTAQTLTEKIVQRYSHGLPKNKLVKSGDYVTLAPHHCMTHDNSWPVALKFMSIGATTIHDRRQIVMTLDHDVQNTSERNLTKYRQIEEFATKQGVDFYPAGRGIGHQIMVEEGYAWPGTLAVASDSHSNMYGGVGCLGTPVVRTDAAAIWATGRTWWQIPPIAKVTFAGVLPRGVTGKDVIVALCGLFNDDQVLNHAIEFTGSPATMASLPVDHRLAIANMTTEWGALTGLFPIDDTLRNWLRYKATSAALATTMENHPPHPRFTHARLDELFADPIAADPGAKYAKTLHLDLSTLSPFVAGPNSVKAATPLPELEAQDIKINKAYLVSCTNSRASDIASAAQVFREAAKANGDDKIPRVADGVEFYIAAASLPEQHIAEEAGDWQVLLDAGAQPLPAGCGPCIGLGTGLLEPGEVGISASNRNFKGRMGSTEAKAYLASPEVVAASALGGKIRGPGWFEGVEGAEGVVRGEGDAPVATMSVEEMLEKIIASADDIIQKAEADLAPSSTAGKATAGGSSQGGTESLTPVLPGFPEKISGEIVFLDADNINTDAIYPGKYTYQDAIPRAKMAEVCMENYDPRFSSIAREGDILVGGFNFGCGSSREQAATAILAKGVPLVVAGSFGNIFGRNAVNNSLMGLEVPRLVERLRETFGSAPSAPPKSVGPTEPRRNKQSLDSPPPAPLSSKEGKVLTRRTGWTFTWDVARSKVVVREGEGGREWEAGVGEVPPNVQEVVARGGLEGWVRGEIGKGS